MCLKKEKKHIPAQRLYGDEVVLPDMAVGDSAWLQVSANTA